MEGLGNLKATRLWTANISNPERHEYELYLALEDTDHSRTRAKSPQTEDLAVRSSANLRHLLRVIASFSTRTTLILRGTRLLRTPATSSTWGGGLFNPRSLDKSIIPRRSPRDSAMVSNSLFAERRWVVTCIVPPARYRAS